MINLIFTSDCYKILILFSLSPGSRFNRKEIKEKTRLNNVPLDKALSQIIASGVAKREKNYYYLNIADRSAKELLEICRYQYQQLRELPLAVFYLLTDLVDSLLLLKGNEVWLFGSYAKLVYKENSDVDIAVLYSQEIHKESINKNVAKLEKVYNKKIEMHYFEKTRFYKNRKDLLVKGILRDGVRLI